MTTTPIMRWAREQRAGHVIAKSVLFVLAAHADKTGQCKPSYRLIAQEAETSEPSVRRAVHALVEQGLVHRVTGSGRGSNRYQLAIPVRHPGDAQPDPCSASRTDALQDPATASPRGRTTGPASASPEPRSASSDPRSASSHLADQQQRTPEVVPTELEVLQEGAAPPPPARARAREARAGARGGGELVPVADLNRTATRGPAYLIVSDWAAHQPGGLRAGARRELNKAVDQLLAQPHVDPELIPEALDEAHRNPRFRIPARALPSAYDEVWRRRRLAPPAAERTPNANDAAIYAFLGQQPPRPAIGDT